ncbi:hypothetical protein [Lysinibacillus sphaericus]|nr:hypothetical protein [Lysinibacillus sphaericus]
MPVVSKLTPRILLIRIPKGKMAPKPNIQIKLTVTCCGYYQAKIDNIE